MAIAYRTSCNDVNSSGNTTLDPTWSVVPTNGDVLIMCIASLTQSTITIPAGWNLLDQTDSGSGLRTWLYWKVAASEPSQYNVVLGGGGAKAWAWVAACDDVRDTEDPPGAVATPNLGGTTHACPSVSVPANGWLLNIGAFRRPFSGTRTYTINDGSAAERFEFATSSASGNDIGGAVYDSNRALTLGSYARTITGSGTESTEVLYSIVLTPATVPPISGGGGSRWGIHL